MEDEKLMKEFFNNMKKQDEESIEIPAFPAKRKRRVRLSLVFSSLAVVVLAGIGYTLLPSKEKAAENVAEMSIIIETGPSLSSDYLIKEETAVSEWESPTASLINDF
ncbi:hypothetical protein LVD15_06375 [Fulvivirga maritima]|uniref:hypothetical protein n=1 Tax=Fulvivirga maritima TaxID=2904247 RepID=UPI001F32DB54|nr:hypothetical protein [Fulvivirga maritima]UII28047.1 hypothetical protein LVD15_06375 [Fulvivirga maritima]